MENLFDKLGMCCSSKSWSCSKGEDADPKHELVTAPPVNYTGASKADKSPVEGSNLNYASSPELFD